MKKLKFKINDKNMLTKEQMKSITGGYGLVYCEIGCVNGPTYSITGSCHSYHNYTYDIKGYWSQACITDGSTTLCCEAVYVPYTYEV